MYFLTNGISYLSELHGNTKEGFETYMTQNRKEALSFKTFEEANKFRIDNRLDQYQLIPLKEKV